MERNSVKVLPDGRVAEIVPLLYGRARLIVGPNDDAW